MLATIGDSRTAAGSNTWPTGLVTDMSNAPRAPYQWTLGAEIAQSGWSSQSVRNVIDARLAAYVGTPDVWLVNIGINDWPAISSATTQANLEYVLDALHAKFPATTVYVMRFGAGTRTAAVLVEYDGVVDSVVAVRAPWCKAGPDERVWLENGDGYTTFSNDLVHYNGVGQIKAVAAWRTVLGY